MHHRFWILSIWTFLVYNLPYGSLEFSDMHCSYGDSNSLTVTCYNATSKSLNSDLNYSFDHLDQTFRCVNCTLTIIKSSNFDFDTGNYIKELDLRDCKIEVLNPSAFVGLVFMDTLDLSYNNIKTISAGTFKSVKKIRTIDLTANRITVLSNFAFAELIDLALLHLKENYISKVEPQAFAGIANLKFLDLSSNRIKSLNHTLHNLINLEVLFLKNNRIYQLNGSEFSPLTALVNLNLSENFLTDQLSIHIQPGNHLQSLDLSYNFLDTLWFSHGALDQLMLLDVSHNNISLIMKRQLQTGRLSSLKELFLNHNKLREIRTSQLSGLPQLKIINVSFNLIERVLVNGFATFQNLDTLDLSYNRLTQLDYKPLISRMPSLAYLSLMGNILPCNLYSEMMKDFADDNFKYVFTDDPLGTISCVDTPVVNSTHHVVVTDTYLSEYQLTTSDLVMFLFMSLTIAAIGVLFYVQFLFYKAGQISSSARVDSTSNLIEADNEQRDEEFERGIEAIY